MDNIKDSIDKSSIDHKGAMRILESFLSSKIRGNTNDNAIGNKFSSVKESHNPPILLSDVSEDEGFRNKNINKNEIFDPFYNNNSGVNPPNINDNNSLNYPNHTESNIDSTLFQRTITYFKEKTRFLSKMDTFTSALIPAAITLVITNSAQPLLIFLLRQYGGTPMGAYLFLFPTYLSMICVGLYPTKKALWEENWIYPGVLSGIDFLHQVIEKAGLLYCGPCLYTMASSSNTLFLALFTSMYLNVKITRNTAISIAIITIAVSFSGSGKLCEITSKHLIGFALVIFASVLNAFNFVIGEIILKENKIEGPNLVCIMGFISFISLALWTCIWTIPNWSTITSYKEINVYAVVIILLVLFVSNFIRSSVYWILIKRAGSLFTGVLKALRIVIVIIISHILFSHIDPTQSITLSKLFTALMCSTGIVLYSIDNNNKIDNYKKETKWENAANDSETERLMVDNDVNIN